jgi:hypothetical protein
MSTIPTGYTPTVPWSATDLVVLAAQYAVLAKRAKQDATDTYKNAESEAVGRFIDAALTTVTLPDGTKVTLKGGLEGESTRSIDAEALAALIPATVLDKVTKRSIDLAAFDAAVTCGLIDPAVVEQVTTTSDRKRSLVITSPIKR